MSRRFGRNQRRRMREAIAQLELNTSRAKSALQGNQKELEAAQLEIRKHKLYLARVAAVLGDNFIGLPPAVLVDKIDYTYGEDARFQRFAGPNRVIDCHVMQIIHNEDEIQNQQHFHVQLANGRVSYAMSRLALRKAPAHVLADHLAGELATALVDRIRRSKDW